MKRLRPNLFIVAAAILGSGACTPKNTSHTDPPVPGQTSFVSSAPAGGNGGAGGGSLATDQASGAATPKAAANGTATTSTPRTVEETDLYRVEGNRLYYLNSYRGLMVFDMTDVDHPKLLGRSPIFGDPVEMLVRNGIATIVVADWYGQMDDGTPFHGSIVRGLDATDPTNIKVLGEAKLGGWVQDTRVVGDVLYAVSEDYGWYYGWNYAGESSSVSTVIVSSVSFAGGVIQAVGKETFPGYSGIFNVTPNSILLAHDVITQNGNSTSESELLYLDISDPAGAIVERGSIIVNGSVEGWGADNGRWNLDFADGATAHVVAEVYDYSNGNNYSGYVLSTVDFSNPIAPSLKSQLNIPSAGWGATARFDTNRLYLSPDGGWTDNQATPFQVYDLTNAAAPKLAGTVQIPGSVWNILPAPSQTMFALGNDYNSTAYQDSVSLKYLNVADPANPQLIATSTFGQGWAWTPAAGTFKAFTMDPTQGLVVLPFAGWSDQAQAYNNGLQLIEFSANSAHTAGAAKTKGWVERGIFVGNRLVSLSDLALSVVDYSNHNAPVVTAELTLARNVITAQPSGSTIAEVSTDWWFNDVSTSEVRVLPLSNADELTDSSNAVSVTVDGVNAQVFYNGSLAYIVTDVRVPSNCPNNYGAGATNCYGRAQQVQIVDLSNGGATLRGKLQLPVDTWGSYYWGWWGFYWYDWYDGAGVVQVGKDAIAFRRWEPIYDQNGYYIDANSDLYVVDLSNADAPQLASLSITSDPNAWWGNMRVVGNELYTTHYEWFYKSSNPGDQWTVKYYLDRIDLSDRQHPKFGSKVNVPGLLIGGSDTDPTLVYTIDYRWDSNTAKNDFDVLRLHNDGTAELLSTTPIDGWVGQTFFQGTKAYMSAQAYDQSNGPSVSLHALDLSNPSAPVDRVASDKNGWGWLLGVAGDRAIVSSGWGPDGVDIYQLSDTTAPVFSQFARTQGWWANGVSRQDNSLYISTGYWGVQRIDLQ